LRLTNLLYIAVLDGGFLVFSFLIFFTISLRHNFCSETINILSKKISVFPLSIGVIAFFIFFAYTNSLLCFNLRQYVSLKIRKNPIAVYIYGLQYRFIAFGG